MSPKRLLGSNETEITEEKAQIKFGCCIIAVLSSLNSNLVGSWGKSGRRKILLQCIARQMQLCVNNNCKSQLYHSNRMQESFVWRISDTWYNSVNTLKVCRDLFPVSVLLDIPVYMKVLD